MSVGEEFDESLEICSLVESMKFILHIDRPNEDMSDFEIQQVAREIGKLSEDTTFDEKGQPIFGHKAISWMVTTVLYCFPAYYEKMRLAQFN